MHKSFPKRQAEKLVGAGSKKTPQFYFNEIIRRLWFGWLLVLFDWAGPESQDIIAPPLGTALLSPRGTPARAVRAALPWALSSLSFAAHVRLSAQQERRPRSYEAFRWAGGPYGGNIKSKDLGNTQTSVVASVALNLFGKLGKESCLTLYGYGYE